MMNVITDDRRGHARHERGRQGAARARQLQTRLDLRRELITEIQKPAAAKRQAALACGGQRRHAPFFIEGGAKIACAAERRGLERQRLAGKAELNIVTRVRPAAGGALTPVCVTPVCRWYRRTLSNWTARCRSSYCAPRWVRCRGRCRGRRYKRH